MGNEWWGGGRSGAYVSSLAEQQFCSETTRTGVRKRSTVQYSCRPRIRKFTSHHVDDARFVYRGASFRGSKRIQRLGQTVVVKNEGTCLVRSLSASTTRSTSIRPRFPFLDIDVDVPGREPAQRGNQGSSSRSYVHISLLCVCVSLSLYSFDICICVRRAILIV